MNCYYVHSPLLKDVGHFSLEYRLASTASEWPTLESSMRDSVIKMANNDSYFYDMFTYFNYN